MDENQIKTKLWWLKEIGLDAIDNSQIEWICICPFCGDTRKHFFLNTQKILFDCKKCGTSGNYLQLMAKLALNLAESFDDKSLARLVKNRELPAEAFNGYNFGFTGKFYTLPIRDFDCVIINVLRFQPGDKLLSAPGCSQGLFNAQLLADPSHKQEPIYLTEGAWDSIALDWLRRKVKKPGIVTAVQGAGQLPKEYVTHFKNRDVYIIHDADEAGAKGETRIGTMLKEVAKSIQFYRWDEEDALGKDIRDIIKEIIL